MRTISEIKRVVYESDFEESIDTIRLQKGGWTVKDGEYDEHGKHVIEWVRWEQEDRDPDVDNLVTYPTFFQMLFAVGISADEWDTGILDETDTARAERESEDTDNLNELGLTVEQRQLILATLKGAIIWDNGFELEVE